MWYPCGPGMITNGAGLAGQRCAAVGSRVGAVMYRRAHLLPSLSVDGASLATPSFRLRPPPHRTGQADFPHPAHREGVIHRGYESVRSVRAFALAYARW